MQTVCSYPQFLNRKRKIATAHPVEIASMLLWPRWHITGLAEAFNIPHKLAVCWLNQTRKMPKRKFDRLMAMLRQRHEDLGTMIELAESNPEIYVTKRDLNTGPRTSSIASHVARSKGQALHPRKKVSEGCQLLSM